MGCTSGRDQLDNPGRNTTMRGKAAAREKAGPAGGLDIEEA
ncbi:hypothetical protein KNP414_06804 [Paenibacillus mucilaginosus KNP414]|uniref:Uncharacterized protein n=1 Tax=Paenibacillus mucilaginosus (strain KNP414) TaxID=1036673 RepID=F8FEK6_PAEMK|nr:hypothetical protein KNP414_06804 [Paenibacillus mucilaginosus KNP414]